MSDRIEFVWTFPLYVLANNYTLHKDGSFDFDSETEFISPEMESGIAHLALFTDKDNAEHYLGQCDPGFRPFGFMPEGLLRLLREIGDGFPRVAIDLRHGSKRARTTLTSDVIEGLKALVPSKDQQ